MSRRTLLLYIIACMGIVCVSCTQEVVYNQYEPTSIKGWERNDTISFKTKPMEEAGSYLEEVGVRINGDYPFTGLSLVVEQTVVPSGETYTDTLSCKLADSNGNILGYGINHYQYLFPLTTIRLEKGASLHVAIRHCMKREILPGISDIGLKLSHQITAGIQTQEDKQ